MLRIGNTRFDAADILDVQVKNPTVESLAKVTFDLSKVLISKDSTDNEITARIVLYVGLSMNNQDSFYANDFVYKGKPLFIEFPVKKTDTAALVATRAQKIAKKYLLLMMGTEKVLDVTVDGGNITFTGVNGYQQLRKAILQKFDPEAKTVDCCSTQGEYIDVITGVPVVYTIGANGEAVAGDEAQKIDADGNVVALEDNEVAILPGLEAFGDYNWIIHNLRLPTAANYYPWSPANRMGEMPIPGQQYTQFIIRIKKERDGIMGEIVGARGVSVTTHVLYVAGKVSDAGSPAKLVDTEIKKLYASPKTDADDALNEPFAGVTE